VAARALGVETGADVGEALVAEALALAVGDVIMDMREIAKKSKVVADALFEVDPESMDEAIAIVAVVVAGLTSASGMEDRAEHIATRLGGYVVALVGAFGDDDGPTLH